MNIPIYQDGKFIDYRPAHKDGGGYQVKWADQWFTAYKQADCSYLVSLPATTKIGQRASGPAGQQEAPISYEIWRNGKLFGEKVTAPRGVGQEWRDRFYCEQTLDRVKRWRDSDKTTKQYRPGSHNDRWRHGVKDATRQGWDRAMAPAYAMYSKSVPAGIEPAAWWATLREVIDDCRGMARYYLYLAKGASL